MSGQKTVDAWLSPGCDTRYSVSLCDDDGEICCIGGSDDIEEAWKLACEYAAEEGVPARLVPRENGEVTRRWEPDAKLNPATIAARWRELIWGDSAEGSETIVEDSGTTYMVTKGTGDGVFAYDIDDVEQWVESYTPPTREQRENGASAYQDFCEEVEAVADIEIAWALFREMGVVVCRPGTCARFFDPEDLNPVALASGLAGCSFRIEGESTNAPCWNLWVSATYVTLEIARRVEDRLEDYGYEVSYAPDNERTGFAWIYVTDNIAPSKTRLIGA